MPERSPEASPLRFHSLHDYTQTIGDAAVEWKHAKIARLLPIDALQRRATVVLQKSLGEGFGLTVAEAMWQGACVVGGNVNGIRRQIADRENGFLLDNALQAAERNVRLVNDSTFGTGSANERVRPPGPSS